MTGAVLALALPLYCRSAEAPTEVMAGMSGQPMGALMGMDDAAPVGKVMLDQLELAGGSGSTTLAWDAQAWYGGDYDKLWIKTEGSPNSSDQIASRNELLWDHVLTRWWDLQTGLRYDLGHGPARGWWAVGVEGLAPYWFEVQAALYLGESGHSAAHFQIEHDLLITRRLIVQPEIEADLYGRNDAAREVRSGLSDMQIGLRMRYEIRREFAPYVGIDWRRTLSPESDSVQWIAGFHVWF